MENCIFCKIVKGEISSYKIFENDEFIVVLDINPASKGHSLIISKDHNKIGNVGEVINKLLKLKEKLKFNYYYLVKKPEIEHFVLQFIPIYKGNEAVCQINNNKGDNEELKKLAEELKIKDEKVIIKNEEEKVIEIKEPEELNKRWFINP